MGCFKMEKSNAKNNSDFFRRRKTNQTGKPGFFPTEQVGFLEYFSGLISKALDDPFFQEPDPITIFCQNNEPNPITIFLRHLLYEMSHNPIMI